jgi:hypothetical protein
VASPGSAPSICHAESTGSGSVELAVASSGNAHFLASICHVEFTGARPWKWSLQAVVQWS